LKKKKLNTKKNITILFKKLLTNHSYKLGGFKSCLFYSPKSTLPLFEYHELGFVFSIYIKLSMKIFFSLIAFLLLACNNSSITYLPATRPLEAAREFIEAFKAGKFEKASFYMLHDKENDKLLKEAKDKYYQFTKKDKRLLSEASIQNVTIETISPTETIIYYNNSFDKERRKVKAVNQNNTWLIDFKYTFNPNL